MDFFAQAAILGAAAYGAIFLVLVVVAGIGHRAVDAIAPWVKVLVCLVLSQAIVFLVASSDWGSEQQILGRPLDRISVVSLVLAGLFVAFVESAGFIGFASLVDAMRNVGYNQPTRLPPGIIPPQVNPTRIPDTATLPAFEGAHAAVDPAGLGLSRAELLALGYTDAHLDSVGITDQG
jgi:hypothetical protein